MFDRYTLLGLLLTLLLLFFFARPGSPKQEWVEAYDELGFVDTFGNPNGSPNILLVTGIDCDPCRNAVLFVLPTLEAVIRDGGRLRIVYLGPDDAPNRAFHEARAGLKINGEDRFPLFEFVMAHRQSLPLDVDSGKLLTLAELPKGAHSEINWSNRIKQALEISRQAEITSVPLWYMDGRSLVFRDLPDLQAQLEAVLEPSS